ncbi:Major intrinsic protein [Parasponia andersonii]|uniref:Major intrinsic protein n=1 Tax=Parasponia andersonii TaxID=3476 RepID=A0A2P5C8H0_PARAD|nr:Major intrinsic protein [Parasponia andersonii]
MANERVISSATRSSTPAIPVESAPAPGGFRQETCVNGSRKSMLSSCFRGEWTAMEEGGYTKSNSGSRTGPPVVSLARKVGAEFIGTLMLIFAATAIAILYPNTHESDTLIVVAVATGLTVMIIIFSTGHISGAHLNPAVTVAFAALKHFPWAHVPVYIGAQMLGSLCAAFALKGVFHPMTGSGGVTVPSAPYGQAFALEFIVTFILMFVNCAVATDTRAVGELAGIAVGATVMLNNFIAGVKTGASMNPVRTLGPAVAAHNFQAIWIYLIAPFLGALFGAATYSAVKLPDEDDENEEKPSRTRSFSRS